MAIPCLKHFQNIVFEIVLLRTGLLFRWIGTSRRAGVYLSNSDCAALRAMTDRKGESALMLFVIFIQLLILCGALHNFACFPKSLPLDCFFIVSQGVAIGLGYAGPSAC